MKTKALYFVAFFVGAAAGVAASFKIGRASCRERV